MFLAIAVIALLAAGFSKVPALQAVAQKLGLQTASNSTNGSAVISAAFRSHSSGVQVRSEGVVTKILPDDLDGRKHQRFIIALPSGQTLLIAHNIDLAPRVQGLKLGDTVEFNGVYEWNDKGGVIHWTHRDPAGVHDAGWLRVAGETFQ